MLLVWEILGVTLAFVMQIASLARHHLLPLLVSQLLLVAAPPKPVSLPSGGSISAKSEATRTVIQVKEAGSAREAQLFLKRDATVKPNAGVDLKLVAQAWENVVIITDEYDSLPGSLSFCQAGSEQFLRVITLGTHPTQTFCFKGPKLPF